MLPWNLFKNSNRLTSYPSVYSVFPNSIAAVMITEYFIGRGHYHISDLYSPRNDDRYYYTFGVNLRSFHSTQLRAYITGILINIDVVGFVDVPLAASRTVPLPATRIYQMSFFTEFGFQHFKEVDLPEGARKG